MTLRHAQPLNWKTAAIARAVALSVTFLFAAGPSHAQDTYANRCKPEEDWNECFRRICKPDETVEDCRERIKKAQEEYEEKEREKLVKEREEREERAEEQREKEEERAKEDRERREDRERDARERQDRPRDRGDDDDGGSSGSGSDVLRPGTRPMFFAGAIGPTFFGLNRTIRTSRTRGKLALDFGYHFSGDFEGPAIGATIEQTFDNHFYVFNPGFKFWWDIQPADDYGIYIAPFAKAGYAITGCGAGCPYNAFNIGFGAEGRILFNDRGMALFRPLQIDTYLGDFFRETFWLNYSVLIGGGVIF